MSKFDWTHLTTPQLRAHCDHLEDMACGEPGELRSAERELWRRSANENRANNAPIKPYNGEGLVEFEDARGWRYN